MSAGAVREREPLSALRVLLLGEKGAKMTNIQKEAEKLFEYRNGELFWKVDKLPHGVKGKRAGHIAVHGYWVVNINGIRHYTHRVIWALCMGDFDGCIDHINGDKQDNRLENLRNVSHRQNMLNKKVQSNNTSGYRGIYWSKGKGKWVVQISQNAKPKNVGTYSTIEDAVRARNAAFQKAYGEYACKGMDASLHLA